jgi:hypothetical protein
MHIVDSCGWLELFAEGPLVRAYEEHLKDPEQLLVPGVVLHEVYSLFFLPLQKPN